MSTSWHPSDTSGLAVSSAALHRTVDGLTDDDLLAPSGLPGWSRAHVVAHLALNAEAFAAVLDGVAHRQRVAMYASDEQRDTDVAELAGAGSTVLRERLMASSTVFADAVAALGGDDWTGVVERTPGGPTWALATVVPTRRREVEVHHADLDTAYGPHDWPADFLVELLDAVTVDHSASGTFRVRATDLGQEWVVGDHDAAAPREEAGPVVMGAAADLGWWLTGRSDGTGLATDGGRLPSLGPWRRASATAAPTPGT